MDTLMGKTLSHYRILEQIGAGGMGVVYRARDERLGRDVAVKVLPAAFASDPQRLERFEQEARSAGVLNHPNILTIYDVGMHDGSPYVVSELLEGTTLRERLSGAALPHRKVSDYALQIARGLAAAHAKGIVHRDLKPENLFITRTGHVKILDFGLAKLIRRDDSDAGADGGERTVVLTRPGDLWGTVGYMSPEQIRGKGEDHRSDLFAFGIVLFEMLTGTPPYRRESPAETMAAILHDDPPESSAAGRPIPLGLERIVRHCLEKNPDDRFQSTRDVAFAVEALSGGWDAATAGGSGPSRPPDTRAAGEADRAPRVAGGPRFQQLTFRRGTIHTARFAPDGHTILYTAAWDGAPPEVFSTRTEFPESRPHGYPGAALLAVSASSELAVSLSVRHVRHRQFKGTLARVPLVGSAPRALMEGVHEADWSPEGRSLAIIREVGGWVRLEHPPGTTLHETRGWISHPRFSPRGDLIAFCEHPVLGDNRGSVAVVPAAGGEMKVLSSGWDGSVEGLAWSPAGDEVWFSAAEAGASRALHAVSPSGELRLLLRTAGGITLQDVSRDGRVLITRDIERGGILGLAPGETAERDLSWLDGSVAVDLSGDGRTLLFMEQGSATGSAYAVCLRGTDGSPVVRLGEGAAAGLSPDGAWALTILYAAPPQLVLLPTGAGDTKAIPRHNIARYYAARWLPDGNRILFVASEPGSGPRCYEQGIDGGTPRAITGEGVTIRGLPISPDGETLVATGPDRKAFLQPIEGGEPRPIPGLAPEDILIRWGADGKSLFVYGASELPTNVCRLDLETGVKTPSRVIMPSDPAGVQGIGQIRLTPDGSGYVYSFKRLLCDLYLIDELA